MSQPVDKTGLRYEVMAYSIYQALAKGNLQAPQKISVELNPLEAKAVKQTVMAFHQGQRVKIQHELDPFYKLLETDWLSPAAIARACLLIRQRQIIGNPALDLILDYFKVTLPELTPIQSEKSLLDLTDIETALLILVLALTRTHADSRFYQRPGGQGSLRPTTIPLNEKTLLQFLQPFTEAEAVIRKSLYFYKGKALGHPVGVLAARHAQNILPSKPAEQLVYRTQAEIKQIQPAESLSIQTQISALWSNCRDFSEREALGLALAEPTLLRLQALAHMPLDVFSTKLAGIYAQSLVPAQARQLACRMAESFQNLLLELRRLADKDWLKLWHSNQPSQSVQALSPIASVGQHVTDRAAAEQLKIAGMIRQAEVIKDKVQGAEILEQFEQKSLPDADEIDVLEAELERVLNELAESECLDEVLRLSEAEALSELGFERSLRQLAQVESLSMSQLRHHCLDGLGQTERAQLLPLLACFERGCRHLANLFANHFKLTLEQAVLCWKAEIERQAQQAKRNTAQWRDSVAGQYSKYS